MDKTYINVTIDLSADNWIDVELYGEVDWVNDGIGSYEYCGSREYDRGQDCPLMDNQPEWDKTKYTDEQNDKIQDWIDSFDYVWTDLFEKQAQKDGKPERDDFDEYDF